MKSKKVYMTVLPGMQWILWHWFSNSVTLQKNFDLRCDQRQPMHMQGTSATWITPGRWHFSRVPPCRSCSRSVPLAPLRQLQQSVPLSPPWRLQQSVPLAPLWRLQQKCATSPLPTVCVHKNVICGCNVIMPPFKSCTFNHSCVSGSNVGIYTCTCSCVIHSTYRGRELSWD